ncbi:MAG: Asp-tRNA(Asn)/Glu-tRNA(Gln) amidotransferase subunit GatA [Ruminococcus sp.]|jgi:aspartyl-tRNA(Asn)/glutamyl-tRNA(Gln) amidotransferase subunit A|nr:Asp-tRNA(Asn)/Glu-tRNA(Gln) amidotransferase subunit GatA [Ruminococcus sp.]
MQINKLPAYQLSAMLEEKQISSVEIVKELYTEIKKSEENIGAFVTLTEETALETAKNADNTERTSPLHGIPIAVKDNISTKSILTTCSSKMLGNYIPPFDATVTEKIKSASMPILGKTNMDEFAMGSSTETSYFKKTKNPHDLERVPGGSSGGSAAAVAAFMSPLSLGSDTGGSIRQPAAFCGVCGLKPTYGTVSRYGLVAFASSLDQIGPFARNITDLRLLYDLIKGYDKMDSTSLKVEYTQTSDDVSSSPVIGLPKEYFGEGIDDNVKKSVMDSVKILEKSGAKIKEISLPSTDYAINAYYIIASAEASSNLARFDGVKYGYRAENFDSLTDMYEKTRSEGFGDEVKRRIMLGTFVLSSGFFDAYYKKAKIIQRNIAREFDESFKECDFIITPTTPTPAFKIGEKQADPVKMYYNDVCTVAVNIAGIAAVSVPCGLVNGLPVGIQFIGDKFSENKLFDYALKYEKLRGEIL